MDASLSLFSGYRNGMDPRGASGFRASAAGAVSHAVASPGCQAAGARRR
ncbi:hypothetical protein BURMUCGD2M_4550 [Burkholderia multivorans CGD2M]|uniref:Uncharacterized protein n=1 Tax=Burkholderia multivorans CGD2 TaxID=513052 RepID=B9BHK6_9BURK|nr:hypothetical protein BURMUCGD2_4562 [Burkholderia multivorans CGD2]EEE15107.1 hypothetical protein BURMUCGD2M_4550 [Burkholderia multivorans CGD2M]